LHPAFFEWLPSCGFAASWEGGLRREGEDFSPKKRYNNKTKIPVHPMQRRYEWSFWCCLPAVGGVRAEKDGGFVRGFDLARTDMDRDGFPKDCGESH
jgi:hypothetical protein